MAKYIISGQSTVWIPIIDHRQVYNVAAMKTWAGIRNRIVSYQNIGHRVDFHLAFCVVDRDMAIKDEGIKLALETIERLASTQNVVQDGKL